MPTTIATSNASGYLNDSLGENQVLEVHFPIPFSSYRVDFLWGWLPMDMNVGITNFKSSAGSLTKMYKLRVKEVNPKGGSFNLWQSGGRRRGLFDPKFKVHFCFFSDIYKRVIGKKCYHLISICLQLWTCTWNPLHLHSSPFVHR